MSAEEVLSTHLSPLDLSAWEYHPVIGSTNDRALIWAGEGAPDESLVVADAQTAGKGRGSRKWITRPGAALAMSMVIRPSPLELEYTTRFTALAALALVRALAGLGLDAVIKWPNDILLDQRKVAGVLVEADWEANDLTALVIGLGVNVSPSGVPDPDKVRYPATSVEASAGESVDRWALLADILRAMKDLRTYLATDVFMAEWRAHLAFTGEWVLFKQPEKEPQRVKVLDVTQDGCLLLQQSDGKQWQAVSGEIVMADQ